MSSASVCFRSRSVSSRRCIPPGALRGCSRRRRCAMNEEVVVSANGLSKTFDDGRLYLEVLTRIDLEVRARECIAIVGASGSGKSTLLHLLGGLDAPTAGEVNVLGSAMSKLSDAERGRLRNQTLGFV